MDSNQLISIHAKIPGSSIKDSLFINHLLLKNGDVRGHFHDCFELEICLNGDATNIINGSSYPLRKNGFYLLSPVDIHKIDIENNLELISIKFTDLSLSEKLMNHLNTISYPIVGEFSQSQSEAILSPLLNLYFTSDSIFNESYRTVYLRSVVEMLLSVVLDQCQNANDDTIPPHIMLSLLSYVKKHFRENIPLSELANHYGYNTNYLRMKFRQLTGKTYVTFVNDERLAYAYRLIELTDIPISEISDNAGYTSQSYFSRIFRSKYGISPIDLRRSLKK